jgi:hypothetical protein
MNVEPAPALAPASAPSFTDNGDSASSSSTSTTSFLLRALLVVLLLGLIGFNVFSYFDEIVAWLSQTFGAPFRAVARFLGYAAADTAKTTVDVTAQGTKSAVDIAAGAATSGINVLQQTIESQGTPGSQGTPASQGSQDDSLERALSHAKKQPPQPDDATSRTQRTRKAGYCYIGEDRGFRSCIRVGEQDTCMSGDIFPTQAVCINPRLRQ